MVVPEGWKYVYLRDLGTFSKGRGISKNDAHSGGIPCVRYGELYTIHNDYIKHYYSHISEQVALSSVELKQGDILFAGSGETKEEIGKCAAFVDDLRVYAGGDIILFSPTVNINSVFLGFLFNTPVIANQKANKGQGDAIVHISANALGDIDFVCPPIEEQNAIAEVLSDTDGLITSLEKLIAKKKAIKQGAMQELLTGKKRMPGFSKEWVMETVGNYGEFISGNTFPLAYQGNRQGVYPFYKVSDFNNAGNQIEMGYSNNYISKETADYLKCNIISPKSVIFAKIGAAIFLERKKPAIHYCCIDNNMMAFTPNTKKCDAKFIWYLLQTIKFGDLVTATALPSINGKQIGAIIRPFPVDIKEQTAIASVLSDMDTEIEQLEKKVAKYRLIKQGMMQELLTGRIRLAEVESKSQKAPKGHNEKYDDAIAISAIVNAFYDEHFYLGRKKVQKLLYLLRRKQEADVSGFKKKAAGPYNEQVRYNGGESIAVKEGYITRKSSKMGSTFSKGKSIETALQYAGSIQEDIEWLYQKFKYYNTNKETNNLEVLATVDMAVCEIEKSGKVATLDTVKEVIRSNKEWAPKLEKPFFTDVAIEYAIKESKGLFS